MVPLQTMTPKQLYEQLQYGVYVILSVAVSICAFQYILNEEVVIKGGKDGGGKEERGGHPQRWIVQAYGVLNLLMTLLLCYFAKNLSQAFIVRRRYGWVARSVVGVGMLVLSTFIAKVRTNSKGGLQVQVMVVLSLYFHLQMVGPSTDFGLVNFGLRIPILTACKIYDFKMLHIEIWGVSASMVVLTIFQEYFSYVREKGTAMEAVAVATEAVAVATGAMATDAMATDAMAMLKVKEFEMEARYLRKKNEEMKRKLLDFENENGKWSKRTREEANQAIIQRDEAIRQRDEAIRERDEAKAKYV